MPDALMSLLTGGVLGLGWWAMLAVLLVFTQITIFSVTLYLHRSQAHRGVDFHPALAHVFRFWLWLTTSMITREWVAIHRKHHAKVETEDDGVSYLRFGDAVMGRKPAAGTEFKADYRVGKGRSGNVGADAIYHIVTDDPKISGARNPLAARGGVDPEPIEQVRIHAPQAFRTQERAVTENDYAEVSQRHPEVQKAVATRRWTGSWHTMFITVDRKDNRPVNAGFEETLRLFLEKYRLAGHDVEVEPPIFVPLDIEMRVCVVQGYLRGQVEEALLEKFSRQRLSDGSLGFWHPDKFTFGQPVYLSKMVAAAMEVPGVMWVEVVKFQRWGKPEMGELEDSRIVMNRLEIARVDNDPNAPENGKMEFLMEGGL